MGHGSEGAFPNIPPASAFCARSEAGRRGCAVIELRWFFLRLILSRRLSSYSSLCSGDLAPSIHDDCGSGVERHPEMSPTWKREM